MEIKAGALEIVMMHDLSYSGGTGATLALLYDVRREIEQQTAEALASLGAAWQEGGGVTMRGITLLEFAANELTLTLSFGQLQALLLAYYGDANAPAHIWPQQLGDYVLGVVRDLGPRLQTRAEEARAVESWERLPASVRDKVKA